MLSGIRDKGAVMPTKVLYIIMHVIFIISATVTLGSFICFAVLPRAGGTVNDIDASQDNTIVHVIFEAENSPYEKILSAGGTSSIRCGDKFTVWYLPGNPKISLMVRDFSAYYILTAIFGVAEAAFFLGRNQRKAKEAASPEAGDR